MALIEVTGRRTGSTHRLPVNVLPEAESSLLVLSRPSRRWWRNLRGGADLRVWYEGRPRETWGEVLDVDIETRGTMIGTAYRAGDHEIGSAGARRMAEPAVLIRLRIGPAP